MWDAILKFAPPVIQAVAIAVTAVFAVLGLKSWRRQMLGKRRIEVAEEALLATYKVRNVMAYIRNGVAFSGEGATRPRDETEPPDGVAKAKDAYFVPLERMQQASGDFAEFEKMRLLCQVHFGPDATGPFDTILHAQRRVAVAARMLVNTAGEVGPGIPREQWKSEIWASYGSGGDSAKDEIVQSLNAAVAKIETLCLPHVKI